jgi:hypothetical protein
MDSAIFESHSSLPLSKAERPRNGLAKISIAFVSPTLEPNPKKAAPGAAFFVLGPIGVAVWTTMYAQFVKFSEK